jgi:mannose-1-phosphate guanylyltransferase
MRAVILVGGIGSRLRPLTYTIPKQLLPVLDVPMIERKIAQLVSQGVDDIVFSMGYRPDTFLEAFPDNTCAGAQLTYVVEKTPLGTGGAIAFVKPALTTRSSQ